MKESSISSKSFGDQNIKTSFEVQIAAVLTQASAEENDCALAHGVLARIAKTEKTARLKRSFVFGGAFLASIAGLIFSLLSFKTGIAQTGFSQYATLIFTDTMVVLQDWQNYAYTILESLPVFAILEVAFSSWFALLFLKFLVESLEANGNQFKSLAH
jgi:hypothetical protein